VWFLVDGEVIMEDLAVKNNLGWRNLRMVHFRLKEMIKIVL